MHSSRMRTDHVLTIFPYWRGSGGLQFLEKMGDPLSEKWDPLINGEKWEIPCDQTSNHPSDKTHIPPWPVTSLPQTRSPDQILPPTPLPTPTRGQNEWHTRMKLIPSAILRMRSVINVNKLNGSQYLYQLNHTREIVLIIRKDQKKFIDR